MAARKSVPIYEYVHYDDLSHILRKIYNENNQDARTISFRTGISEEYICDILNKEIEYLDFYRVDQLLTHCGHVDKVHTLPTRFLPRMWRRYKLGRW